MKKIPILLLAIASMFFATHTWAENQTKFALIGSFLDEKNYVKSELVEDFWQDYGINDTYVK